MSLFIGTLAFDDEAVLKQVRLGVLAASLLSGIVAALLFAALGRSNHVRLRDRAAQTRHTRPEIEARMAAAACLCRGQMI
jgi:hypothetical protein